MNVQWFNSFGSINFAFRKYSAHLYSYPTSLYSIFGFVLISSSANCCQSFRQSLAASCMNPYLLLLFLELVFLGNRLVFMTTHFMKCATFVPPTFLIWYENLRQISYFRSLNKSMLNSNLYARSSLKFCKISSSCSSCLWYPSSQQDLQKFFFGGMRESICKKMLHYLWGFQKIKNHVQLFFEN